MSNESRHERPLVSVVLATYNETNHVQKCMDSLLVQETPGFDLEILAIDGGSTDGTREKLRSLAPQNDVTIVFHERNCGKGASIRTALEYARGEYIIIQDSDLEYDPREYTHLLKPLLEASCSGARLSSGLSR